MAMAQYSELPVYNKATYWLLLAIFQVNKKLQQQEVQIRLRRSREKRKH
jgi:hypothetical protein